MFAAAALLYCSITMYSMALLYTYGLGNIFVKRWHEEVVNKQISNLTPAVHWTCLVSRKSQGCISFLAPSRPDPRLHSGESPASLRSEHSPKEVRVLLRYIPCFGWMKKNTVALFPGPNKATLENWAEKTVGGAASPIRTICTF